jgi:hypothetical protein
MASVKFPIDIIFIQPDPEGRHGRVSKIVDGIYPGTRGSWGDSAVLAVVEVAGGHSRQAGIDPGNLVEFFDLRTASEYDSPLSDMGEGSPGCIDAPHTKMFKDTDNTSNSSPAPGGSGSIDVPIGTGSTSLTVGDDRPFGDSDEGCPHRTGSTERY